MNSQNNQTGNSGVKITGRKPNRQRAQERDAHKLAREHGPEAIEKLVSLMRGVVTVRVDHRLMQVPVSDRIQFAAAKTVLDYGYGRSLPLSENMGGSAETQESGTSALEFIERKLAEMAKRDEATN